jgi:molybdopterin converting factor small subunit
MSLSFSIKIHVKYFGMIVEKTQCENEVLELQTNSMKSFQAQLVQRFPGLEQLEYQVSLNHRISQGMEELQDGDEVALLPPFAGG